MVNERKEKVALFRFGVIHPLIGLKGAQKREQKRLLEEIVSREWEIPFSGRSRICRATVLCWLRKYRESGEQLDSLYPKSRVDAGRPRVMDEDTERALVNLKSSYPTASLTSLLYIARNKGFLPADFKAADQTIYRIFQRYELNKPSTEQVDRRKFQAELPNDLWQSDSMHGPMVQEGGKRRKAYLFAILDDHSRLIAHAQFYLSEGIDAYQDCLEKALAKRGLPRKLYLDNGAAFRSHHLQMVTASLGIALIHARPYRPQGKGKIERWFHTVQCSFLPMIEERALSLDRLNDRLWQWIDGRYHQTVHSSIQKTPLESFVAKLHLVRPAPTNLEDSFRKSAQRKVNRDRTVALNGHEYEAPLGLMGRTVTLRYHSRDLDQIEVFDGERSCGHLTRLEPQINVHVKREHGDSLYQGGQLFKGGAQ